MGDRLFAFLLCVYSVEIVTETYTHAMFHSAMTVIAKNDKQPIHIDRLWRGCFDCVQQHIAQHDAHPARTVVLVPYAQLMVVAQSAWARQYPNSFMPRWETTRNWASRCAAWQPQQDDWAAEVARDTLTARSLLQRAGLHSFLEMLVGPLLEVMQSLAPCVSAVPPVNRTVWGQAVRHSFLGVGAGIEASDIYGAEGWLRYESLIHAIALEWALASSYPTDALFSDGALVAVDALVVVQGLQPDPLAQNLAQHWGARSVVLPLRPSGGDVLGALTQGGLSSIRHLHPSDDAEDEALRAACIVVDHVAQGQVPVALVANDRALTRRIQAHLGSSGIYAKDENGWTLSTTRAAASIMAWLHAAVWDASTDSVLDAIKQTPLLPPAAVGLLERALRKAGLRLWSQVLAWQPLADACPENAKNAVMQADAWRQYLLGRQSLADWLQSLRRLLVDTGLWPALQADAAGADVLDVLYLQDALEQVRQWQAQVLPRGAHVVGSAEHPRVGVMDLSQFTRWVRDVLEAARFKPDMPADGVGGEAPVVVVPLAQLLGRPFAAVVIPGCDERRLPAAPEPSGGWTAQQRIALGLPDRDAVAAAQQAAWQAALEAPWVDILWRKGDDGGEPVLASPLVLALDVLQEKPQDKPQDKRQEMSKLALPKAASRDPRTARQVLPVPTARPAPSAGILPIRHISSSAYSDLRACPYRFVALRLWGLQEDSELESMADKRDFGTWLHAVLQHFHEAESDAVMGQPFCAAKVTARAYRVAQMDTAAQQAAQMLGLNEGEFLPFMAGWPALRDGYLDWLAEHESQGAVFAQAELSRQQPLGVQGKTVQLVGTIDRVDHLPQSADLLPPVMVMDYKTENIDRSKKRIQQGTEDTQLAFYAALLAGDNAGNSAAGNAGHSVQAAYINVGERGTTQTIPQPDVLALRDALLDGLRSDFSRIAAGAQMPALGEGAACDFCHARGLCRKDFWA